MYQVLNCLVTEHDWRLVVLGGAICWLASAVAISLFHRAKASQGRTRAIWVGLDAAVGGCGIWATHFVAMLAYDPGTGAGYNIPVTLLSLVFAVAITAVGLGIALLNDRRSTVCDRRRGGRRRRCRDALHRHDGAGDSGAHRLVARHRAGFDRCSEACSRRWRLLSPCAGTTRSIPWPPPALLTVAIVSHHFTGDGRHHAGSGSDPR